MAFVVHRLSAFFDKPRQNVKITGVYLFLPNSSN